MHFLFIIIFLKFILYFQLKSNHSFTRDIFLSLKIYECNAEFLQLALTIPLEKLKTQGKGEAKKLCWT